MCLLNSAPVNHTSFVLPYFPWGKRWFSTTNGHFYLIVKEFCPLHKKQLPRIQVTIKLLPGVWWISCGGERL